MSPSDSRNGDQEEGAHSTPLLATESWHRFVTAICLLACVGIIVMGIDHLFDPTEGRAVAARPMDYARGICFILLGVHDFRFLIRQFRALPSTSARKQSNLK